MVWPEGGSNMAELSVTLKASKGYEAPWIVVKGDSAAEVKALVADATGLDATGLTLADLVHNASQHFQRVSALGSGIGATVLPQEEPAKEAATMDTGQDAVAAQVKQEAAETAQQEDPLLAKIASAPDQKTLGDLYMQNDSRFKAEPALMQAIQARAKELG